MFPRCGEKHRFDANGRADVCSNDGFAFRRDDCQTSARRGGDFRPGERSAPRSPRQSAIRSAPRWTDSCQALEHKPGDRASLPLPDPLAAGLRQLDLRLARPNVRCHSAWYFRSRRHSIRVGMPLQASQNISTMIGVDATSKSVRVIAAWTIRPLRRPVVDLNGSIRAPSWFAPNVLLRWRSADTASTGQGFLACFDSVGWCGPCGGDGFESGVDARGRERDGGCGFGPSRG